MGRRSNAAGYWLLVVRYQENGKAGMNSAAIQRHDEYSARSVHARDVVETGADRSTRSSWCDRHRHPALSAQNKDRAETYEFFALQTSRA